MKDLLVITTYYDYFGSRYMRPNFDRFKDQIEREGLDLVVYEAAFQDRPFRLEPSESVVQLRSHDMLWQKERMINLAIEKFSSGYRNVAWIDNDILLPEGWSVKALKLIERYPICQLFSEIHYKLQDGKTEQTVRGYIKLLHGRNYESLIDAGSAGNPGTAWIARTSLVKGVGIYDAYINCGNDTLLGIAVGAERKGWVIKLKKYPGQYNVLMNKDLSRHHGEWHRKFHAKLVELSGSEDVRAWSGFIDEPVSHLYHGHLSSRNYMDRYWILEEGGFDPENDLKLNADGLYEWASNKPCMHGKLKKIFRHGSQFLAYA